MPCCWRNRVSGQAGVISLGLVIGLALVLGILFLVFFAQRFIVVEHYRALIESERQGRWLQASAPPGSMPLVKTIHVIDLSPEPQPILSVIGDEIAQSVRVVGENLLHAKGNGIVRINEATGNSNTVRWQRAPFSGRRLSFAFSSETKIPTNDGTWRLSYVADLTTDGHREGLILQRLPTIVRRELHRKVSLFDADVSPLRKHYGFGVGVGRNGGLFSGSRLRSYGVYRFPGSAYSGKRDEHQQPVSHTARSEPRGVPVYRGIVATLIWVFGLWLTFWPGLERKRIGITGLCVCGLGLLALVVNW